MAPLAGGPRRRPVRGHGRTLPALAAVLLGLFLLAGGAWWEAGPANSAGPPAPPPGGAPTTTPPSLVPTLRSLAVLSGLRVGAAVDVNALERNGAYAATLADEYDMVTPENAMKWDVTEPQPGQFHFDQADELVRFAAAHGMAVRGHNLVWFEQNPAWLVKGGAGAMTPGQMRDALRQHITTVVGHFRGEISQWDVVNEAVADDGSLRPDLWLTSLGPAYLAEAFQWAHAADPGAVLFYNDYGIETPGPKADAVYDLLAWLKAHGVPVGGVGFELHVIGPASFDAGALAAEMDRFAKLGLQVAVTEMDVSMRPPFTAASLREQAADYAGALEACRVQPACHTFVTWGFTDGDSWVPGTFPGYGAALPFDARLRPKPAAYAIQRVLATAPPGGPARR